MGTTDIAQGPVDIDVRQALTHQLGSAMTALTDLLGSAMAAKMDNILREAVARFLGRDDWTLGELKGRGALQRLPNGVEVFCLDGVALVELHPITVEHEQKGASHVLHATRQYRFLLPNASHEAERRSEENE